MAEDIIHFIERYLDRWLAQDINSMVPMLSEDFTLWHNHIGKTYDKQDMLAFIRGSLTVIHKIEFRNRRWTVIDQSQALLQHEMYVEMRDGQVLRDVPNAIIYTRDGQQLTKVEEYVDGAAFEPLNLA